MKKKFFPPTILLCFLLILSAYNCKPDDSEPKLSDLDEHINDFIWKGLNEAYLWVDNVPDLSDSNFPTDESYDEFINATEDHEDFFYSLLYRYEEIDRFSWIVDDYEVLEQMFEGITKSMGFEFKLYRINGGSKVFGAVLYVLPGTPADAAGIKRGDLFIQVNGQDITEDNYYALLFENETYTLTFASIINGEISSNGETATLTAIEIYENPIYLDTVYYIGGKTIGYIVYNGFMSNYDLQLNEVFRNFKNQNIDDLILDLRYNGGGSVRTATYLSSMIYSTDTNKMFVRLSFNTLVQAAFDEEYGVDYSIENFADRIEETDETAEEPIVSLGLDRIFIIATGSSASASELVICGLRPYIDVVTIGTSTYGKYVGSITLKDTDRKGNVNTEHKYAMQPIVFKTVNSVGESDYVNGFAPTDSIKESLTTFSSFGNINEPLLSRAISHVTGDLKSTELLPDNNFNFVRFGFSKDRNRFSNEMYIENKFQRDIIQRMSQH